MRREAANAPKRGRHVSVSAYGTTSGMGEGFGCCCLEYLNSHWHGIVGEEGGIRQQ